MLWSVHQSSACSCHEESPHLGTHVQSIGAIYIMEETRANKNTKQEKQHGRVLDFKKSNPPTTMYRNDERYGRCASMYQQKHGLHAQVGAVKCATKR